jgi:glycosyltransferase involved in cell wall biosynthesis
MIKEDRELPQISIVVPLFNEADVFENLIERLKNVLNSISLNVEVVLVDDGSMDNTPIQMASLSLKDNRFTSIFLSRNFGHQNALTAGLIQAGGSEGVFIIDGDLQDPPELLFEFYQLLESGYDVVYAVRKKRKEGFFKKLAYKYYYQLQKKLANIDIPLDSGDFSLISRRVVDVLNALPEESRYIRGLRTWVGFKQIGFEYERSGREFGVTKYSLSKLFKLAFNGIFNFSELPIKFITGMGLITVFGTVIYLISVLIKKYLFGSVPEGFTALIVAITLFGGIQLICFGILGEYIVRIFFQVKKRPNFIVKNIIINKEVSPKSFINK